MPRHEAREASVATAVRPDVITNGTELVASQHLVSNPYHHLGRADRPPGGVESRTPDGPDTASIHRAHRHGFQSKKIEPERRG